MAEQNIMHQGLNVPKEMKSTSDELQFSVNSVSF